MHRFQHYIAIARVYDLLGYSAQELAVFISETEEFAAWLLGEVRSNARSNS